MALAMYCNNSVTDDKGKQKKCGQMEPYLDPKTDKVYCSSCNTEMPNITYFTKVTLKNLKQFKQKVAVSFSVKCQSCNREARPKVVNDDIVCPECKKPHTHLSEPFKIMLKEKLKTAGQDV
jgi:Zn finger protein HypA/HybF involved in hydrogenase expression